MKIDLAVINLVADNVGRAVFQMESMGVPKSNITCYMPGYIIQCFEAQLRNVTYAPIRDMIKPGITIFGVNVLPGYEQNKIVISNTKAEVFPDCVKRIEINLDVDFKGNVMPCESQLGDRNKIIIIHSQEPFWRTKVDVSEKLDRMSPIDFEKEYLNNPMRGND